MKKKTVTKTYYQKKTGTWVTKTYTYDYKKKRAGKSLTLVGKGGKEYKDRIKDVIDSYSDPADKADIRAIVKQSIRDEEKLSIRKLTSKLAMTKYEKMLINAGYSIPEFEKEYGIKFSDWSNPKNWTTDGFGGHFFNTGTKVLQYAFSYDNAILR